MLLTYAFGLFDCEHDIILPPDERLANIRAYLRAPEQHQVLKVFHTDNVEEVFNVVHQPGGAPLSAGGKPVVCADAHGERPNVLVDALQRGLEWTVPGKQPGARIRATTVADLLDPTRAEDTRAIIAPSGAGKSATVLQVLTKQFGCYMEMPKKRMTFVTLVGKKLQELAEVQDSNGFSNKLHAETVFRAAHVSMLLVLEAFVEHTAGPDGATACTPRQWTNIMLTASHVDMKHHAVVNEMFKHVFRETEELGYKAVDAAVDSLRSTLDCPLLCVDEAQRFLDTDTYGKYKGPTGSERSVFTCLLDCPGLVLLGTGLRLEEVAESIGSSAGLTAEIGSAVKAGRHGVSENRKRTARRRVARSQLLTVSGCDVASAHAFAAAYGFESPCDWTGWAKLVGRARLTAKFVERLLMHTAVWDEAVWDKHLKVVFGNFAGSIAEIMADRLSAEVRRSADALPPVSYRELAVDLLRDIIWRNGVVTRACHEVVEFIDYGICMLTKDATDGDLRAVVREPLAREALLRLFRAMGWDVGLCGIADHMLNAFTSPHQRGLDFERLFIVEVAMKALTPTGRSGGGGGVGGHDRTDGGFDVRRAVFGRFADQCPAAWPKWKGFGCFSIVDCRSDASHIKSLMDFLQAAKDGSLLLPPDQGPVFCFPEEAAGPDVVTLLRIGDSLLLWSVQVKLLANKLGGRKFQRAAHTSMYNRFYDATQSSGKRQQEMKTRAVALCRELCGADTRSLSTLCVLPAVTRTYSDDPAGMLEQPVGNEFVVLNKETLGKIMSHVAFKVACGDAACSADLENITDGIGFLDFDSHGGGGAGGGGAGGGSDDTAK